MTTRGKLLGTHDFDGIEALYAYSHKNGGDKRIDMRGEFSALATELGLLAVGGSNLSILVMLASMYI